MFKKLAPLAIGAALVGCTTNTPPAEITEPPASASFVAGYPAERIAEGTTQTTIRTFRTATDEDGKETLVEVVGAKCSLASDHIRADVVTPQKVVLPKYDQDKDFDERGVPPSILISCKYDGLEGSALLTAKPGQIVSGSGNLAADLILIAGSAIVATTQNWRFEEYMRVTLE